MDDLVETKDASKATTHDVVVDAMEDMVKETTSKATTHDVTAKEDVEAMKDVSSAAAQCVAAETEDASKTTANDAVETDDASNPTAPATSDEANASDVVTEMKDAKAGIAATNDDVGAADSVDAVHATTVGHGSQDTTTCEATLQAGHSHPDTAVSGTADATLQANPGMNVGLSPEATPSASATPMCAHSNGHKPSVFRLMMWPVWAVTTFARFARTRAAACIAMLDMLENVAAARLCPVQDVDGDKAYAARVARICRSVAEQGNCKHVVDQAMAALSREHDCNLMDVCDSDPDPDVQFISESVSQERTAHSEHLYQLLQDMRATSLSTEFSGIDTPATSFIMMGTAICAELNMDKSHVPAPANMSAVEWSAQAREELLRHPHCPQHVFGDMNDFWRPHIAAQLDVLAANDTAINEVLLPLMRRGEATIRKAWCYKHGQMCEVDRAADLHVAGTPCTDYSQRGLMMREQGVTWKAFLSWISRRWDYQESLIIQENVINFDASTSEHFLGAIYFVSVALIDPNMYGMPITRPRQYCILRHKWKTGAALAPVNVFVEMFRAPVRFGEYNQELAAMEPAWDSYFGSPAEDIWEELMWACSRPESRAKVDGCGIASLEAFKHALVNDVELVRKAFERALTTVEFNFLAEYRTRKTGGAYSLNQNPNFSATMSGWSKLHTLIRNAGILW
ncbi:unnamed protein product [Symbiodinium natans]|uniref:Uncharacterized protein n=1 Tax=Symbiodinium natans TaxID=878477 RepID=A0A812J747_9DINO|nr:unnamed protein product [Symbiodinium natans]